MKIFFRILFLLGAFTWLFIVPGKAQVVNDSARVKKRSACASCNCQSLPAGVTAATPMLKNIWMFSYRYMDMDMKGNLAGTGKASDEMIFRNNYLMAPRDMNMQMHMLMGMYGVTSKLTLMAMLNYNVLNMQTVALTPLGEVRMIEPNGNVMIMPAGKVNYQSAASGFGDVKLYGIYSLLKKGNHNLTFSLGLSIPTADINYKGEGGDMYIGQRQSYMIKLGSGTWDVLPGITYLLNAPNISWGTQVSGIYHTGYNSAGFQFGNELDISTWISHRWSGWVSNSLHLMASDVGSISGNDSELPLIMEPATNPANYGGQKVVALLGMNFSIPHGPLQNASVVAEFGLPVYQNVNGIQTGLHTIFNAGLDYMF